MRGNDRTRLLGIIYRLEEEAPLGQAPMLAVQAEFGMGQGRFNRALEQLRDLGCLDYSHCRFNRLQLSSYGRSLAQAVRYESNHIRPVFPLTSAGGLQR
jgi:hypothetical protein